MKQQTGKKRITIIGTGCIGTSIGLALKQSRDASHLEIVGHDREPEVARLAQKKGALDRVEYNLDLALHKAVLVILAVPLSAMRQVLQDVGGLLPPRAGVVITDTAPLKAPVLRWAEESLPEGSYFVGGDPFLAPSAEGWGLLRGTHTARADLFSKATYAITARAEDHPGAVTAVVNLARTLGATPYFMSPAEHDATRLYSEVLPAWLAAALAQSVFSAPGWVEARKAAGRTFAMATAPLDVDPESLRMLAFFNRATLLRALEEVQQHLTALQGLLAQEQGEVIEETFARLNKLRESWVLLEAPERVWEPDPRLLHIPGVGEQASTLLLGGWLSGAALKADEDDSRKA